MTMYKFGRLPLRLWRIAMTGVLLTAVLFSNTASAEGIRPFIQKMFNDVPDNYSVKIIYVTGKEESFELASHKLTPESQLFEFATKDDIWHWVPLSNVTRVEFDKRFSKLMSIREQEMQKKAEVPPVH